MGKRLQQTTHRWTYSNGQWACEKVLCFISHQGNAVSKVKCTEKPNACEDIKQYKMSNIANGSLIGTPTLDKSLLVCYKIKQHSMTHQFQS